MVLITIVTGAYKPTSILAASHCRQFPHKKLLIRDFPIAMLDSTREIPFNHHEHPYGPYISYKIPIKPL